METLQEKFNNLSLIKCFEIEVINKETGETECIIFNIECNELVFKASHISLTKEQELSNKISYVSVGIDEYFTLNSHLNDLYDSCIDSILSSDFYDLV